MLVCCLIKSLFDNSHVRLENSHSVSKFFFPPLSNYFNPFPWTEALHFMIYFPCTTNHFFQQCYDPLRPKHSIHAVTDFNFYDVQSVSMKEFFFWSLPPKNNSTIFFFFFFKLEQFGVEALFVFHACKSLILYSVISATPVTCSKRRCLFQTIQI